MRKIVAAPKTNEYKKAYYKKCGKPSALELEKKEIDVAAPEVGGVEADGSERGTGSTDAKERKKEYNRVWQLKNKERKNESRRMWRLRNKERKKEHDRVWKLRNSERIKAYN